MFIENRSLTYGGVEYQLEGISVTPSTITARYAHNADVRTITWHFDADRNDFVPLDESGTLPLVTTVEFPQFKASVHAKVDTGASMCSMHATNIHTSNSVVSFQSDCLGPSTFTMRLADVETIKSADGGNSDRPVVALDVVVDGVVMNNVLFNLNDRSHMEHPVLLGVNALQQGDFTVSPSTTAEAVDHDADIRKQLFI